MFSMEELDQINGHIALHEVQDAMFARMPGYVALRLVVEGPDGKGDTLPLQMIFPAHQARYIGEQLIAYARQEGEG